MAKRKPLDGPKEPDLFEREPALARAIIALAQQRRLEEMIYGRADGFMGFGS